MNRDKYLKDYAKKRWESDKIKLSIAYKEWVIHNLERKRELNRVYYWRNRIKILNAKKNKGGKLRKQSLKDFMLGIKSRKVFKNNTNIIYKGGVNGRKKVILRNT